MKTNDALSPDDQKGLKIIEDSLRQLALRDIKKVSAEDNVIASFILCSCFIDQLGGIEVGGVASKAEFISFVKRYLKMYDADKLYLDLRCKLVHNYSVGDTYALVRNFRQGHRTENSGLLILNIEDFVEDLEAAFNEFIKDVWNNPDKGRILIKLFSPQNGKAKATGIIGGRAI